MSFLAKVESDGATVEELNEAEEAEAIAQGLRANIYPEELPAWDFIADRGYYILVYETLSQVAHKITIVGRRTVPKSMNGENEGVFFTYWGPYSAPQAIKRRSELSMFP